MSGPVASPAVEGFVLAGGRSSRMGTDKALLALDGVALGLRVAEVLGATCGRVRVVRRDLVDPGWRLSDGRPVEVIRGEGGASPHPLWGVAAALRGCAAPLAVFAATDLWPLRSLDVRALARGEAAAWGAVGWVPLFSLVPARLGEVERLASEGAPLGAVCQALPRHLLDEPPTDLNTPEAFARSGRGPPEGP